MKVSIRYAAEHWLRLALLSGVIMCFNTVPAHAEKLVLRIRAGNPAATNQMVKVRTHLPPNVSTNHILATGGLEVGYDVRADVHYVYGEWVFAPKETRIFDVEIEDIWVISEAEMEELREQGAALTEMLTGTEFSERADLMQGEVERRLAAIQERQEQFSIAGGARPIDHIRAYETNRDLLAQVKRDIARLENLVLGTGRDPGRLLGEMPVALTADLRPASTDALHVAVIRYTVSNSSPDVTRTFPVRRELPAEIGISDVLDGGGLEVGIDAVSGLTYVEKRDVELEPGESVTFEVRLLDRWNVHAPRIERLRNTANDLLQRISTREQYSSVRNALESALEQIDVIAAEEGPERLNERYVAFYRDQGERLDEVEQRILRIQEAMRPVESSARFGFSVKAPTMKTTWMIIYIILGFLAVISLLFFLRWYGRSGEEELLRGKDSQGAKTDTAGENGEN